MKTINNNRLILSLLVAGIIMGGSIINPTNTSAVSWCTTDKCKAAEAAEQEATEKANNASEAADTLDGEIERLNQEIRMYEARIIANKATADDLKGQIEENTKKLELQQQALANMLIDIHFEGDTEAIMVLASSNSISDFAEKQSRIDTVKTQVNLSAQTIKSLKEDLERQKQEVERVIADQEVQQKAIEETKRREEELIALYRANAAAFAADAAAARREKEAEIAEAIRAANSNGAIGDGLNTYPMQGNCPRDNLRYSYTGGYVCQCTSYAGWKVKERYGITISAWGNANNWANTAKKLGYRVDHTPEAGSVAVSTSGQWGHVMWVENVNSNGTINVSEYNNSYSAASHLPGDFGYRIGASAAGLWFIHFV